MSSGPFDDLPVFGALAHADAAVKLSQMEWHAAAEALESAPGRP